MLGLFKKQKKPKPQDRFYPRKERKKLEGDIYIKRSVHPTLHANKGNISEGRLYVELINHDLVKGTKVELIHVKQEGAVKKMSRMSGIVIRIDQQGVAFVTYKKIEIAR